MKEQTRSRLNVRSIRLLNSDSLDEIAGGTASSYGGTGSGACYSRYGGCGTAGASDCGSCDTYYCCMSSCCGTYKCVD